MQIKRTKQIYADVLIAHTICLYIHHSVYTLSTESRGAEICHSLTIVSDICEGRIGYTRLRDCTQKSV